MVPIVIILIVLMSQRREIWRNFVYDNDDDDHDDDDNGDAGDDDDDDDDTNDVKSGETWVCRCSSPEIKIDSDKCQLRSLRTSNQIHDYHVAI